MTKIFKGISALIIASILAAGVCCVGFVSRNDNGKWFKNGNLTTWHWSDKPNEKSADDKPGGDTGDTEYTGGAVIGNISGEGISLYTEKLPRSAYAANGVASYADSAYILSAIIEPNQSYYQCATWSVAWVNPDSAWAQGKTVTDYVTLSSYGGTYNADSLTTAVECLQAFGEQIKITCVCTTADVLTAECTVDYVKKVVSIETDGYCYYAFEGYAQKQFGCGIRANYSSICNATGTDGANARRATAKLAYSDYTIDDTFTVTYRRKITYGAAQVFYNVWGGSNVGSWRMDVEVPSYGFGMSPEQIMSDYGISQSNDYKQNLRYYLVNALANSEELMEYGFETWTVTATGAYSSYTRSSDFGYTRSSIVANAGSVDLSDSNIQF